MAGKSTKKATTAVSRRSSKTLEAKASASSKGRTRKPALRSVKTAPTKKKSVPQKTDQKKTAQKKAAQKKTGTGKQAEKVVHEPLPYVPPAPRKALSPRSVKLRNLMLEKRVRIMKEIQDQLGHTLTEEQQRRFESAMDSGDQAVLDLDREMDISLQEKRNRERQMIDEALVSLDEGTYGICVECEAEISEKRLAVMPFTRLCVACQERSELFEKIERGEQRS